MSLHSVCHTNLSVRNNSLSQDIFRRKTLFVSACLHLYGNNVQMKLWQTKSKGYWKLLIYIYNVKSSLNFNTMSRQHHLCPCKFYYILTVHQPMFLKLFRTLNLDANKSGLHSAIYILVIDPRNSIEIYQVNYKLQYQPTSKVVWRYS